MEPVNQYQALYSISDLHLGGKPGFQIFDQGRLLVDFLTWLATSAREPQDRVALVINGDMVDFLAHPQATYFDPVNAVRKLQDIATEPAFAGVWDALTK